MLQTELKSTVEESKLVQEKYKSLLEELRKELTDKNRECQELAAQVILTGIEYIFLGGVNLLTH